MSSESTDSHHESPAASRASRRDLTVPTAEQTLDGVMTLGREVHLEMDESQLVQLFAGTLAELFPERFISIRVMDPRSLEHATAYTRGGELRVGVESDRITLKQSSLKKTRVKTAIAKSARIRVSDKWDSPFVGLAAGFAVPLVAAGELYGVLDIGYPLGVDGSEQDEALILPFANHLSVALRNERLHRETTLLRDYQAKLIEHANALILGVDRNWRITVCNQALCQLTGFSRDELMGRDLRDWLPVDERPLLVKMILTALSGRATDAVDVELPTRNGQRVRTVWSVASITGRGEVQAVVAIGQDQTKLRDLQSQVIQAEKLATLGQLAAGVVHELNNPLTSITVYAEYLLRKAESGGTEESDIDKLRRISAGAQRIMAFARDLVQYAKPAGNQLDLVAVNNVVRQSLSFCEHLFERSEIALREDLAADLPAVYAVPGQIEQVVINLVTNAVHACGRDGEIRVRTYLAGPTVIGIAISDNGPGIAATHREKVFEPFFTTKTDGKGTGLGLSIVRNIVEQHGGEIRVDEARQGGAEFTCLFPTVSVAPGS